MNQRQIMVGLFLLLEWLVWGMVWRSGDCRGEEGLELLAERALPGRLAVAAILPDGRMKGVHEDQPMPLQSVFKFILGAAVLDLATQGKVDLEETISLQESDLSVSWSPIAAGLSSRSTYTIRELIQAAVAKSDNSAADWLLKEIGGPTALTQWLHRQGFQGIRIDRYERELQTESTGLELIRGYQSYEAMKERWTALPREEQQEALDKYLHDERDTATAREMVSLLAKLHDGELLDPESTHTLLEWMEKTKTGSRKIKAVLPPGYRFWHKTGRGADILGTCLADNDVGIIETKKGERVVIAVFLAGSKDSAEERAKIIREAASLILEELDS